MGIQGLIPFLKKASRQVNIKDYAGCTVAIDAYCWIHKGAFGCAEKLGKGEKTDGYVYYCMKMINSLLSKNINPIMVFDGCNLPAKAGTESTRRESREKNRKKAKDFLRKGQLREARECFQRCVDVTPEMALDVIQACHKKGVDCIVAPYEADAQLAYLSRKGIANIIITEDSDLVLFGCEKILFKMDSAGNGIMVEKSRLQLCMGMKADNFTFDKFRYMCIMSGCDYLPSLPGIGLQKSCKFFSRTSNPDLNIVLSKIPFYLNMPSITVTKEYIEGFFRANNTFLYQLVFDPCQRKLLPLTPYPPDVEPTSMEYAGKYVPDKIAFQMALGNVNVKTKQTMHNFDPDNHVTSRKASSWENPSAAPCSIWSSHYKPAKFSEERPNKDKSAFVCESRVPTKGKEVVISTDRVRKRAAEQRKAQLDEAALDEEMNLVDLYCEESPAKRLKPVIMEAEAETTPVKMLNAVPCRKIAEDNPPSPVLTNTFISPINRFKVTSEPKGTVQSRFFSASDTKTPSKRTGKGTLDLFEQIAMEYDVGSPIPTGRNEKTVDIRGVLNNSATSGTPAKIVSDPSNNKQLQSLTYQAADLTSEDKQMTDTFSQKSKIASSPVFNSSTPKSHHPSFAWKKLEKFSFKGKTNTLIDGPKNHSTFKPVQPTSNTPSSVHALDTELSLDEMCNALSSQDEDQNSDILSAADGEFSHYTQYSVTTRVNGSLSSDGPSSQSSEISSQELSCVWKSYETDDADKLNDSSSPECSLNSSANRGIFNLKVEQSQAASLFTTPQRPVLKSGAEKGKTWPRQSCRRTGLSKKAKAKLPKENGLRQLSIGETLQQFQFKKNTFSWKKYCDSRSPLTSVNLDPIVIGD